MWETISWKWQILIKLKATRTEIKDSKMLQPEH